MGITVFISLFTTRIILNSLGASDFGIFNIIGGAIGMLGFLNSTMSNATQRFMSYEEGKGNLPNKRKVFNISIILHAIVSILTILLLLIAMYPLFNGILTIESERVFAAKVVYISLIISTAVTILTVPYDAVINAHENMLYYSLVGIFESILKLLIAVICVYTSGDKLIIYGVLMAIIPMITFIIMLLYCHKNYTECKLSFVEYFDKYLIKNIVSFSGWNFLTAVTSLLSAQGIGLVLNHFYGTVLNAAQGIAQQLNGQLSSFSTNLMKALNPVIVKSAGAGNVLSMNKITMAGCKYSTFLILLFAIPFMFEMQYILKIWLKDVPSWTSIFCLLQIIQTIICQMSHSVAIAIYAQGDIKNYAIYKSIMNALPIVLTYICFKLGGSPYWLYIPMILVWAIGGNIVILYYGKIKCNLRIRDYVNSVVLPILFVILCMSFMGILSVSIQNPSFVRLIITVIATSIGLLFGMMTFGMSTDEKYSVKKLIIGYIKSNKSK